MLSGHAKILIATILFSLGPLLVKTVKLDAISILWAVSFIAAVVLTASALFRQIGRSIITLDKAVPMAIALGIFFVINNSLYNWAVKTTSLANAVLTHYLAPIFVLILGIILIREKVTKLSVLAVLVSFGGLLIMISPNEFSFKNVHFLGLFLGTLSAIFYALEIIFKKKLLAHYKPEIIMIHLFIIGSVFLIPFTSFTEIINLDFASLIMLLTLGVLVAAVGGILFIFGLKEVKAQYAGIMSYIEPLGAIVWGLLVIAEIPTIETVIGGFLIIAGTYLIVRKAQ